MSFFSSPQKTLIQIDESTWILLGKRDEATDKLLFPDCLSTASAVPVMQYVRHLIGNMMTPGGADQLEFLAGTSRLPVLTKLRSVGRTAQDRLQRELMGDIKGTKHNI